MVHEEPYAAPRMDAGNRWVSLMDYPMDITIGWDGQRCMATIRHAATTLSIRLNKEGTLKLAEELRHVGVLMPEDDVKFTPQIGTLPKEESDD